MFYSVIFTDPPYLAHPRQTFSVGGTHNTSIAHDGHGRHAGMDDVHVWLYALCNVVLIMLVAWWFDAKGVFIKL